MSKRCDTCTPFQQNLFDSLVKDLQSIKASWAGSEELSRKLNKLSIEKYMESSLSAGSEPGHLLKHLNDLSTIEYCMILNDSELLKEPQKMAEDAVKAGAKCVLSIEPPQPVIVSSGSEQPFFSKSLLLPASHCCRIVNEHVHINNDVFSNISHKFSEMSISTSSKLGRYLIAKQSDSIFYIAFQREEHTEHPEMEITACGMLLQDMDQPLAEFVAELLIKKKKQVILSGSSFGGIHACSLLIKVWRLCSGTLSQGFLQKNFTCITFGQPHIPVPGLKEAFRVYPQIAAAIHAVLSRNDVLPRLLGVLYNSKKSDGGLYNLCDAFQMLHAKHHDEEVMKVCASVELAKALPALKHPITYHLFIDESVEESVMPVCKDFEGEELGESSLYNLHQVNNVICGLSKQPANEVVSYAEMITTFVQMERDSQLKFPEPKQVTELIPNPTRIKIYEYKECSDKEKSEFALAIEGNNLWFFSKVEFVKKEVSYEVRSQEVSGNFVRVNFSLANSSELSNDEELNVRIVTSFDHDDHRSWGVTTHSKKYVMSKRQKQLAKLTPSKVIELSYLCALLEKQPKSSSLQISARMDVIRSFLEEVTSVVPLESLGYSIAFADLKIREKCAKVLELQLPSSKMMHEALLQAMSKCDDCKSRQEANQKVNPSTGTHESGSCKWCSYLEDCQEKMGKPNRVICDLNIKELYPNKFEITSPIEALKIGKEKLKELDGPHEETKSNDKMLEVVKGIRKEELSMCISLIGSFMDEQEMKIPLETDLEMEMSSSASVSIGVWALSSFKMEHVNQILSETHSRKLYVDISNSKPYHVESEKQQQADSHYCAKLKFIVQGLKSEEFVTYNSQCVSYSLETQLLDFDKGDDLKKCSVKEMIKQWCTLFRNSTLSLVAESHRPMVARWLKWSLMIHTLREELAKYTAVGVVGLLNSGKSTLINSLFQLNIPTGTLGGARTTVPFIYSASNKVEGLEVVDFPGMDDCDKSIGELAELFLSLSQIAIFVVDYRKTLSESCKKWLKKLEREEVPVLVCLSYADQLYKEVKRKYPRKSAQELRAVIDTELLTKKDVLNLPKGWEYGFYFFAHDDHYFEESEDEAKKQKALRDKMKAVGICDHSEVGAWLVKVLEWDFFQPELAQKLEKYLVAMGQLTSVIPPR